jgi:hypothetical protein
MTGSVDGCAKLIRMDLTAGDSDPGSRLPVSQTPSSPDGQSHGETVARDRNGVRIEIGSEVTVVDAIVDWPGHGEHRLVNIRAEVRSSHAASVLVRVNGVDVGVDSSQVVCVVDPNARKRGGSLAALTTALTDNSGGGLAGRLRNAKSEIDKAVQDDKQDKWEAEWAVAVHQLKVCPRPNGLAGRPRRNRRLR